jgi:pimeloyl-ACP methyl ester carboxylesterase
MLTRGLIAIVVATTAVLVAPVIAHAQGAQTMKTIANTIPPPTKTGHVEVRGVNYYYEIRGEGEPLLLLHGGLFSIGMFGPNLAILSAHHQVIGVDLHGHGRSTLGDRPISPIDMGNDMAAIVKQLGHRQVDVLGYSLGGGVALRLAIQHPDAVRRLVLLSTPFSQDGFFAEMLPQQAAVGAAMVPMMKDTPIYQTYMTLAPHPDDFPKLLDRMGEYMRQPFNWAADVKKLNGPVMLVYGDSDMYRPEHIVEFYHLLGGGLKDAGWGREHMSKNRLAILPDLTHYEIGAAPALGHAVLPFLDGESSPRSPRSTSERLD